MTVSAVPFCLQNVPINADVVRQAMSSLLPNNGGYVQDGDLAVTATSTPSMAVVVGVGRAWFPGTNIAFLSGQTYGKQGMYFVLNDSAYTVTIAPADSTNPRIDVIYAAAQDSAYSGSTDAGVIAVQQGTPAATPVAPSPPNNSIILAQVAVAANATSISNANITQIAEPLWSVTTTLATMNSTYQARGSGYPAPAVYKRQGRIFLSGSATNAIAIATLNANTFYTLCTLPSWANPVANNAVQVGTFIRTTNTQGDAGAILITNSGGVQYMCNSAASSLAIGSMTISLDGISWIAP